jgi:hypothetical protein
MNVHLETYSSSDTTVRREKDVNCGVLACSRDRQVKVKGIKEASL